MPGVRDRNLRSGDLHEELGLVLLRTVGLVAPVPRPEDVGVDAFVTLVRPEGSRRLLPDLSFLVQLKAASIRTVSYAGADEMAWLRNLEIPLFVGRVHLAQARIEVFATHRLHHLFLEPTWDAIHLHLDSASDASSGGDRWAEIGPPVLTWAVSDVADPKFPQRAYEVLRPHVELLSRNRHVRSFGYQQLVRWETGQPPTTGPFMMMGSSGDDLRTTLTDMVPHVRRLLLEVAHNKRYGGLGTLRDLVGTMRHWGVDPDPESVLVQMTAMMAEGPEITVEEAIRFRYLARGHVGLYLSRLDGLTDSTLAVIPEDVEMLAMEDTQVTDAGIPHLLRLTKLTKLNLAGTKITDAGIAQLTALSHLQWLSVARTGVTADAIERLKASLPALEVGR